MSAKADMALEVVLLDTVAEHVAVDCDVDEEEEAVFSVV